MHQDSVHKRVNSTYMEVGLNYKLPLQAVATSRPVGCLAVIDEQSIVCSPSKYTCTKCQEQFKSKDDLHPHVIVCGKLLSNIIISVAKFLGENIDDHLSFQHHADQIENRVGPEIFILLERNFVGTVLPRRDEAG